MWQRHASSGRGCGVGEQHGHRHVRSAPFVLFARVYCRNPQLISANGLVLGAMVPGKICTAEGTQEHSE